MPLLIALNEVSKFQFNNVRIYLNQLTLQAINWQLSLHINCQSISFTLLAVVDISLWIPFVCLLSCIKYEKKKKKNHQPLFLNSKF